MINRWFHTPRLHVASNDGAERKVSWLELFYDLIYVAAIIQLGNALSEHVGLAGFLGFAGLFAPIWLTWTAFTFYSNRFLVDDFTHRLLVFVQMFGIGAMAVAVPDVLDGRTTLFALAYGTVRLVLVLFYVRAWIQVKEACDLARRYALGFAGGVVLWYGSALLPTPWVFVAWAAAMALDTSAVFSRHTREVIGRYPPDLAHLTERYGLLTIIVLGESFVKVLTSLAGSASTSSVALMGTLALAITCALWWIYFDDVAGSRLKALPAAPWIWVYTHLPLTLAITAVGVAIKKAVVFEPAFAGAAKYRWLLCGALALALFSVGLIDQVTERRHAELSDAHRVRMRIASALAMLLLAPSGAWMPASVFLALVAALCIAQVLFDMMMAPESDPAALLHEHAHGGDHQATPARVRARRALGDAVRLGTPNELRRDLYFHLMHGSWSRVIAMLVAAYLAINVVFAALYMLEPGALGGTRPDSFLDAFSFSVQTMSTIGYGAFTPQSAYAHALVAVEAGVGLLGVALATGLMFAKAARPRASILFSDVLVVTTHHGAPTLMFRAGNARGNEIVEATVHVALLRDELSPEGERVRQLYDLGLRRDNSPVFTLSWTVMHRLDADSPLHGLAPDNAAERIFSIIVTLTGHDATYGQTVHARQVYLPQDLRFGERFADVLSQLPDGRMQVDYTRFHTTVPLQPPAPPDDRTPGQKLSA